MTALLRTTFGPQRVVDAFQKAPQVMLAHGERGLDKGAARLARAMKLGAPKAFSTLANSINVRTLAPLTRAVGAGVDYADFVNEGTGIYGPNHAASGRMPPVQSIEDWIRVKRLQPRPGMTEHGLAFVIARKIAKTGTKADPFADRAADAEADAIRRDIEMELQLGVDEVLRA